MTKRAKVLSLDVHLWGNLIGKVVPDYRRGCFAFRYSDDFRSAGIEPAPLMMPTSKAETFWFPDHKSPTYLRLPGLLSDSIPDAFGRKVIARWYQQHEQPLSPDAALEMLAFVNSRGMGALEFRPSRGESRTPKAIRWNRIIDQVNHLEKRPQDPTLRLDDLITLGASAGGRQPKAVICWDPATGAFLSGQSQAPLGFEHWLVKFGTDEASSLLCRVEYAYSLMARAAGIQMEECRLHEEYGRAHFMTKRFDRGPGNERHHVQTLCAMAHMDFQYSGAFSYQQLFEVILDLQLPYSDLEEAFRRMAFNVMARNVDDHTKNIAFRLKRTGRWELAPAYDITFVDEPGIRHQMAVNLKTDDIKRHDLLLESERFSVAGKVVLEQVRSAIERWPEFADKAGLPDKVSSAILDCLP